MLLWISEVEKIEETRILEIKRVQKGIPSALSFYLWKETCPFNGFCFPAFVPLLSLLSEFFLANVLTFK